jgi:hypothetical protein
MKFIVWREDLDPDDGDGNEVEAFDVRAAAERRAEQDHAHRGGWEWTWPVVYLVKDVTDPTVWIVEVQRRAVPEFEAERPRRKAS